jgi:hypothetical protein
MINRYINSSIKKDLHLVLDINVKVYLNLVIKMKIKKNKMKIIKSIIYLKFLI